jgi:hypothetical protein
MPCPPPRWPQGLPSPCGCPHQGGLGCALSGHRAHCFFTRSLHHARSSCRQRRCSNYAQSGHKGPSFTYCWLEETAPGSAHLPHSLRHVEIISCQLLLLGGKGVDGLGRYILIALAAYQKIYHVGGEEYDWSTRHIWRAQLGLTPPSQTGIFVQLFCDWGRQSRVP